MVVWRYIMTGPSVLKNWWRGECSQQNSINSGSAQAICHKLWRRFLEIEIVDCRRIRTKFYRPYRKKKLAFVRENTFLVVSDSLGCTS